MPTKTKVADKPFWVQVMDALNARPDLRHDIVESLEDWRVVANAFDEARIGGSRFAVLIDGYGVRCNLDAAVIDAVRATVFEACGRKEGENGMA